MFQKRMNKARKDIEKAQCCFETDQCETYGVRSDDSSVKVLRSPSYKTCDDVPSYDEQRISHHYVE